jgi:3-hydroxyisobutyrate dehydrogenase-like beta-hydroxyacid dehydrogenase
VYLDANAISPERARRNAGHLEAGGARFVDGGIIGPPATTRNRTWLYLSGESASVAAGNFCAGPIEVEVLPGGIGRASALKLCFAANSKGSVALAAAVMAAAEHLDVLEDLKRQWSRNSPKIADLEAELSRAAPKAWRYVAEMREIASTFESSGLPPDFHQAAAEIFHRLEPS